MIDHSMGAQVFGALEALRQALANCLLDHPGAGEADHRAGLGDVDVAEHRVGGGHAAGGRIGQDDDIGKPRGAQTPDRDRRARHLHEREHALLHSRARRTW